MPDSRCRIMSNEQTLFAHSLTRSSSAVRFGVLKGACGTSGSLPRFTGKGSSGKPLHISFNEDILSESLCHTLEQKPERRVHAGDGRQQNVRVMSHWLFGRLCPPWSTNGTARTEKGVFGNYWSVNEFEVGQTLSSASDSWCLTAFENLWTGQQPLHKMMACVKEKHI